MTKLTEINGEIAKSLKTEINKTEARLSELNAINKPTQEQKTQIEQLTEQMKSDQIYLEVVDESIEEMKSKAAAQQGQDQEDGGLNGKTLNVENKRSNGMSDVENSTPNAHVQNVPSLTSTDSIRSSNKRINPAKQKDTGQSMQVQDTVLGKGDKIQQGVAPYSQEQIEWLHGHGAMVEGVDIEIGEFYEKAIAENKGGDKNKLYFGQVSPELAKRIKSETGYDTAGYDFIVNEGTMHHSENRHGVSSTTLRPGEIPINRKLVALLPEVLNNPDTISKEPNATKGGETIIKFRKRINGYVAYLQVYGKRKGRKNGRLTAKTYYVESSKNNEAGGAVDAETPNRTSENDSTLPSDTIIRIPEEKSNADKGKAAGRLMPASFKVDGSKTNVKGIASVQSGKVTVKLENGDLAIADDLKFKNKKQGQLYDKARNFDTNAAKAFTAVYESNIPVNDYYLGFTRIHGAARSGKTFEQAIKLTEYTSALPSHIQKAAYNAGVQAGAIGDDASMINATSVRANTEQLRFNKWLNEHNTDVIAKKQEIIERFKEAEANGDVAEMNKQRKEYQALEQWSKKTIRDRKAQFGKAVGGVVKSGGEKVDVQADKTGLSANATDISANANDIGANATDIGKAAYRVKALPHVATNAHKDLNKDENDVNVAVGTVFKQINETNASVEAAVAGLRDGSDVGRRREKVDETLKYIGRGLSDISFTSKVEKTAEELNDFWKSNGYENPPYKLDIPAFQIKLTEETSFVKVYDGVNSNEYGQFVMKLDDITKADGSLLSAQQIKDKYALEFLPKYVADVKIPAGTIMNCGIAGSINGWGPGRGLQFDLNWQKVGDFKYREAFENQEGE